MSITNQSKSPRLEPNALKVTDMSKEEAGLFNAASKYAQSGDLLNARDTYRKIIEKFPTSDVIVKAEEGLGNTNVAILLSSVMTPDSFL